MAEATCASAILDHASVFIPTASAFPRGEYWNARMYSVSGCRGPYDRHEPVGIGLRLLLSAHSSRGVDGTGARLGAGARP